MLFYITDSLIVEKRDNRYPKIRKAIRNLLIGYSESKLMLLADYSVLEWMLNQFEYDEDLISPLKYLYVNYATMGIPEELKFYWEIRSDIASESKRENGDVVIFSISYLMIQDSVSIQKCALIGEDENTVVSIVIYLIGINNIMDIKSIVIFKMNMVVVEEWKSK